MSTTVNPTLQNAVIVNDEVNDDSGQLAPGQEAVDGDNNALISIVRSPNQPTASDIRPIGQLWIRTTNQVLYWSGGNGIWFQVRDAVAIQIHAATHAPNGADEIPWYNVHGSGTFLGMPAAGPTNNGYLYFTTDTGQLFRSDGTTWTEVGISSETHDYTHTQGTPATGWVVNHNLGRYPSAVSVIDTGGTVFLAPIHHNSVNQLVVSFGRPTAGTCKVR